MSTDSAGEAKKIWLANEKLWNENVEPKIIGPIESSGGIDNKDVWHQILTAAFGRSLETFQAVQRLSNPRELRQFWADAFVLTRLHFETLITLEWIAHDEKNRSQMYLDEQALKKAQFLEVLGEKSGEIPIDRQTEIDQERAEIERKYKLKPGTRSIMPRIQSMVDEVAMLRRDMYPNLRLEYDLYYRDVSGFAHPSAWGFTQSMTESDGGLLTIESTPKVGEKALLSNGGWFLRILRRFNNVCKVVPDAEVTGWQEQWARSVGLPGSAAEVLRDR